MQKPTPLQARNLLMAALMLAGSIWNLTIGGAWWISVIFVAGCALSITSAVINRPKPGNQP
jgi:uncharacterized membrane protein YjjP (DUF1212 family)